MARLTENLSFTPYIDTYMGAPVEEFRQAVAQRQQLYDDNLTRASAIEDALGSIRAYEGDQDFLKEKITPYMDRLNELADSGDYERALNDVVRLGRKFTKDEDLRMIQDNFNAIQEYQKRLAELGGDALDFNPLESIDPVTGERRAFSTRQRNELGDFVNRSFQSQVEQRKDYAARMQDLMRGIQQDGSVKIGGEMVNIEDLGISAKEIPMIMTRQWSGVGKDKVRKLADAMVNSYMETPEGVQDYRRLTKLEGLSDEEAQQDIANRLFSVAQPQIGEQTRMSATSLPDSFFEQPEAVEQQSFEFDPYVGTAFSKVDPSKYEYKVRASGNLMIPELGTSPRPNTSFYYRPDKEAFGKFSPEEQQLNDQLGESLFGKPVSKMNEDEKKRFLPQIGEYLNRINKQQASAYLPYDKEGMAAAKLRLEQSAGSRMFLDPETGETFNYAQLQDNDDYSELFDGGELVPAGVYSPDNPWTDLTSKPEFALSERVILRNKEGKEKIFVTTSPGSKYKGRGYGYAQVANQVSRAARTGQPQDISHLSTDKSDQIMVIYRPEARIYEVTINGNTIPYQFPTAEDLINTLSR